MNKIFFMPIASIVLLIFLLGGCTYITHYGQISLLKKFESNQCEIDSYLKRQQEFFYKLIGDVKNNRLKKGIAKKDVLSLYGKPIFCKNVKDSLEIIERCLYRPAVEYFNTDRIYLNFDKDRNLYSWEFIPAPLKP